MKRFVYICVLILPCVQSSLAYSARDLRDPSIKGGSVKLDQHWRITFEQDYLADDQGEDLRFTYSDMGLVNRGLIKGLEFGFNYRQIYQRSEADPWKPLGQPHLNLVLRGKVLALDISNGVNFEYLKQEDQKDLWRYRNKFVVKFPALLKSINLQPYVAHDLSADMSGNGDYARAGISYGASIKLSRNIFGDFYYRWQTSRYDGATYDYKILGTSLRLTF